MRYPHGAVIEDFFARVLLGSGTPQNRGTSWKQELLGKFLQNEKNYEYDRCVCVLFGPLRTPQLLKYCNDSVGVGS